MKEWFRLQQQIFERVRQDVEDRIATRSPSLKKYEEEYFRDQENFRPASLRKLEQSVNRADFVFIGDFHALRQSQRFLLRLLKDPKLVKPQKLAFEVVQPKEEKFVSEWLAHKTKKNEEILRRNLKLEENWGSSFETYKEIFLAAEAQGVQILGIGSPHSKLEARDAFAAKHLSVLPEKTWILIGAYHCARTHLPRLLRKSAPPSKITVLQQDDDRLGLKLLKSSARKNRIFQAPTRNQIDLFCIQHSPVWVKWQSMLSQLDPQETSAPILDQMNWFLETLFHFFEDPRYPKPISLRELKDVQVVNLEEEELEPHLKGLTVNERKSLLLQLEVSGVAALGDKQKVFLIEGGINSCAHAAAAHLLTKTWQREFNSQSFYGMALREALIFMLSKILNHSRRTKHWIDFQQNRSPSDTEARKILRAENFFEHFNDRRRWLRQLRPYRSGAAQALGRIIADCGFEAFLSGELSRERMNRMLTHPPLSEAEEFLVLCELHSLGKAFQRRIPSVWSN